jgi:hypothetical protein
VATPSYLFSSHKLADVRQSVLQRLADVVRSFPAETVLDRTVEDMAVQVEENLSVAPLDLHWDEQYTPFDQARETRVDVQHEWGVAGAGHGRPVIVDAIQTIVRVPFDGDRTLFSCEPSTCTSVRPVADVDAARSELVLTRTDRAPTPESITGWLAEQRRIIDQYVGWVNAGVAQINSDIASAARSSLGTRRDKLLADQQMLASLPIPVRPAVAGRRLYAPVARKTIRVTQRPQPKPFVPEAELENAVYEDVLTTIASFATALERSPNTFTKLHEEELRDFLLVILNANFVGQGGGEVFNNQGKTDILVRHGDRNVFIAECKIWTGPKAFGEAVDQLLGYTAWRDSKAALIVFIRNKDATAAIASAVAAVSGHPQSVRALPAADAARRSEFILRSTVDEQRTIRTALLPFVVPAVG